MVFESLVSDLLNRFIGNYVENLDKSQLKIGIWGGNVILENLRVKENALSEFDVPFKVKAGQIGKLSLKIPWKNLYNEAVVATLEDVYVLVVPGATIKYDAEKEECYLQEAKQRELQRIDDALQTAAHKENPQEERKDTFVEKLATQVIKNLQVKVTSIHIRYEDNVSNPQKPLSIGVTLAELSLQTTDENWKMCILDEASKIFYKLGRLECLCAYWNVNSSILPCGSFKDIVDMLKGGISTKGKEVEGFQYIFKPIFATAKICINPNAEMDLKSPKVALHLEVEKISLEMTKPQYLTMVELLECFEYMVKNAPYRKFRPDVPVHTNARQWWQYGIHSILEVHIRRLKEMWSWPQIRQHRQRLRAYRAAYKSHLIQGKTKGDRDTQIKELEKVLDVFNITMARQQAQMEVIRSGQKVVCKRGGPQKQSGGFFSSLFGRKDSGKKKEEDNEKQEDRKLLGLDAILTSEEKEKLYTAIGYSGSSHNLALPKQYVAVILSVKLMRTSIILREAENVPEILKIQMVDLTTQISQRPGAQAIKLEAGLEHWYVTGLQQRGLVPSIIASMGSNSSSLLNVQFEVNPEEKTADQLLYIQSQPVEIIYDAVTINTLADFFKPTKGVDLEVITSATLLKLEEIKEKTAAGLSHIIQTRKVLDLRINLKPSYFLLPFSGFNDAESDLMILDFGSLQFTSVDQASQQLLSSSSLEEVMDQAYERYSLELHNVQLLFCKAGKNWKAAHQQGTSHQHILQPMDFTLQLSKCMVDQDARMPRFKLLGELPLLHVKVSEQKIKGMFNLLKSIPLPSSMDPITSPKKVLATPLPNTTKILNTSTLVGLDTESDEDTSDTSQDEELQKITKAELTDLQFKIEVKEVLLQLTRDDINEQCVLACVCQLGADGKLRTYDMSITSYLRKVSLDHCEIRDSLNQPLHLIRSSDAQDNDLLKVVYVRADPSGPHFLNVFENTEQTIKVEFSSLDFLLHTRALLSSINYLSSALPEELKTNRDSEERRHHDKEMEKTEVKGSKDADVLAIKVVAVLGSFGIRVCDDQVDIANIKIRGINASAVVQSKKTDMFVRLKDIVVMDTNQKTLYKKVVSIVGEEVFSFKLCLYHKSTERECYLDTSNVDGKVSIRMGCIQIVYLHNFFVSLRIFVDNFQAAKLALTAATSQAAEKAASSMKEFSEKSFRLSMDVILKAPLIIIPQSSSSHDALLVDLGLITVSNSFSLVPDYEGPLSPLLETMDIKLTQLKLCRTAPKHMVSTQMSAETELLKPINLEFQVKRNLSSTWFSKIPGLEVQGVLKAMNICLGEEDFSLLTKILKDNIGEENRGHYVDMKPPTTECHRNEDVTYNPTEVQTVSPILQVGDQQINTDGGLGQNIVNIQLNFEIMEVTITLKKPFKGIESPFLDLNVSQLGINMTTRTYDLCATTYIQTISLRCLQFLDRIGGPLCLVKSTAECGTELLKVQYAKADRNGPNFTTTYKNTEQIINILFSSLDVKLHTEALLSVMNYLSSVVTQSPTSKVTTDTDTKHHAGPRAHSRFDISESPADDALIDMKILMKLGAFNILLCDLSSSIADVRIQGLQGLLLMQQSEMHISTSLKDFIIEDVDPHTLHTKAISVAGDEVFRFTMSLTPKATEGSGYGDMTKMDGCVKLSVGCIQLVYLHKFFMSLLNFSNHFHMAKEALSVATTHAAERAASSVRDLAQKSVRVSLDIRLKAPVIIIPESSVSRNALLIDLGLITVDNTFSMQPVEGGPLPVVIEHMNVCLSQLKLSRVCVHQNYSTELLEPVNLVLSVQRNLASSWYRSLPAVQIHGDLKPMKISLSQEDLKMALSILMENTGEVNYEHIQKTHSTDYQCDSTNVQDSTVKDMCIAQKDNEPETEELLAKNVETLKFSFNITSLGIVLFGIQSQKASEQIKDQPFGEFTLHQMRTEGKVLSDNSLEITTVLKTCNLHDHRITGERVTSRMLGRRDEDSSVAMIDLTYTQNRSGRKVTLVLQNLYLCASVEFLLAVADFFIQAVPKMPSTKVDKTNKHQVKQLSDATFTAHNHPVWMQQTYVHAVVVDPEVVFVANQTCAQAPSLVASFQCDCHLKSDGSLLSLSSNIKDLQLLACPFIHKQEDKAVSTVLHPCSVMLEGRMEDNGSLHFSLDIDEVIIKISPVIINTVLTISTAMNPKAPAKQLEVCSPDGSRLWGVMDINSCNYWFLGVEPAQEMTENFNIAKEPSVGENFRFQVKVVQLILESGLGHHTVPLLLAESSLTIDAHNWTSQLQLNADMTLEVNYFNENNAIWEPLIERVNDGQHRWKLSLEMKTSTTQDKSPVPGDDFIVYPEPQTSVTICSRDTMNITLSRCSLSVFSNLAKAFSEGAASSFDYSLKEKAPFTIQNALGLPLLIQHSNNLRIADKPGPGKLHEVDVDQSIDLSYSVLKPLTRACLSPLQRQESCLLLSMVPTGYSEISSIPIDKPCRRLYNIRGPHEIVSVVLQVDAKQGNRVITVRSPLQIKNHFDVPFAILKYCPTSGHMVNVAISQPEKELHVSLESYRCQLFLLPVGNLEGQYLPSSTCITWRENVYMSTELQSELLCPATSSSFLPLVVKTLAVPDDLTYIACQGEEDWDPAYIIHLYPAVTIRNLLPYSIQYLLEGSAQFYEVSEGSISDVLNTRITGEIMELMLLKYQGRNWSGRMKIHDNLAEFFSLSLISQTSELVVDLHVHVSKTNGNLMLSIFSPYWIINKTSRVLQYSAEDICVKHPSDFRDVILFSFKKKNFFSKSKLQLSVSTSSWSDAFSLDTVGSYGCVRCPDKNIDYLVGVCIQMSSFNLSRIVIMTPFYMLANQTSLELEVGEVPSENHSSMKRWHYIGSKECIPLWPELTTSKLCVRVVGSEVTSKSFHLNKQDNGTLLSLDEYGGLLVDVNILDHSTVVSFSDYYEGSAPALLINHTSNASIMFQQSGCKIQHKLNTGVVQNFAWDDPSGVRKLRWNLGDYLGELDLVKDEYGSFTMDDEYQVHWVSFLDGRQRVLLFTEDVAVIAKARQAEEMEQIQQEISVSLHNLGLSLINNRNKREIAYVGITSSGVVWEMKPKTRWKSFNQKNISLLEKAYQSYLSSAKEPCWVKVESNLEVNFGKLPMQMRQPYICPIRRNSLAGIQVEYKQSKHQRSLRAQLHWLQVDNQLPGAIFPVVFHPVPPPKSLALDSEPKSFIDASIIMRFNEHSQVMQFKYFMALIQEMAVKIDQGFLGALITMFTPSVDDHFSKKQLIVKDLDTLQEQLMETSKTDSSGLSFFEHFHISPIKLHLSLSLGSSGDEEEEQEMAAIQSLNLLLKSFGATLTDVDDLIFKLAFFEVRFQFYRKEKLMSAVMRHYSEQFLKQMYVLVLGLDVLGNPFGLIRGLSEGVEAFFYEPFQGAVQGPEEFAEGFAIGVRSLLGHTVGGAAGMVSRITGSVGKGLAAITMDKEYQQKRREERNRPPKDFGESLAKGGKGFLKGVVGGVTGIVTKPVEGAKKEGAAGFFKGIGKGLVGVVARPTGGIVDMASTTFQGIQRVAESAEEVNKLRPARLIQEDGVIRPYNLHEAQGYDFYQRSEIKQEDGEVFREHFDFPGHRKSKIILTNRRVMCVKEIEFVGHFSKDWECFYKLFYKPPSVEGSDVKLYCKEQNKLRISKKDGEEVRTVTMKSAELAEKLRDAIVSAQMAQHQQQMARRQSRRFRKI